VDYLVVLSIQANELYHCKLYLVEAFLLLTLAAFIKWKNGCSWSADAAERRFSVYLAPHRGNDQVLNSPFAPKQRPEPGYYLEIKFGMNLLE
jgi:hypothetical protein